MSTGRKPVKEADCETTGGQSWSRTERCLGEQGAGSTGMNVGSSVRGGKVRPCLLGAKRRCLICYPEKLVPTPYVFSILTSNQARFLRLSSHFA